MSHKTIRREPCSRQVIRLPLSGGGSAVCKTGLTSHLVALVLAALVLVAARLSALAAHHIAVVLLVALVVTTGHFILIC